MMINGKLTFNNYKNKTDEAKIKLIRALTESGGGMRALQNAVQTNGSPRVR